MDNGLFISVTLERLFYSRISTFNKYRTKLITNIMSEDNTKKA